VRSRREVWFPLNASLALALQPNLQQLLSYIVPPSKMVIKVTNYPKFLRDIELYGRSEITHMEERIIDFPENLQDLFDKNPEICENNLEFTNTPHTPMKREGCLFITQRRQATSDIRENPLVTVLGSHAAMTCQIVVMKHTESCVASIGHFDNHTCWQHGKDNSAHKEGMKIMIDEIEYLSKGDLDKGHIMVSVFGGYTDERGDAARNSMSLLEALHDQERTLELVEFCVGPYNTRKNKEGKNEAILIGIAIDLRSQKIFPASYPWNNFEDFSSQLQDRFLRRTGQGSTLPDEDKHKTKLSTFKPKALRNPKTFKNLQNAVGKENSRDSTEDLSKKDGFGNPLFGNLKPMVPRSKDYEEVLRDEALKKIPNNLKPVSEKSTAPA